MIRTTGNFKYISDESKHEKFILELQTLFQKHDAGFEFKVGILEKEAKKG